MKIPDPVLAPDVSIWCDHINPKEFEDEGCGSVVVGLYPVLDSTGAKVLSPTSRQHCIDVVTKSSMVLQAYFWDDIIQNPIQQADWLIQTLKKEGLPIKWVWADQEQWWLNWTAWQQARGGRIPWNQVPAGTPGNISTHYQTFMHQLHGEIPQSGVYTNKGFVTTWSRGMDAWICLYHAWVPHYGRQPKEVTQMTWPQFRLAWLPNYDITLSAGQKPELVVGHQFTGDICKLPGSYSRAGDMLVLDVNTFSKVFLDEIRGIAPNPIPTPTPVPQPATVDYIVLYARINVRAKPDSSSAWIRFAVKDEVLQVVKIENNWALLLDGTYVFAGYINPKPETIPTPTPDPVPQPTTDDYVVLYTRINVRKKPDSNSTWVRFAVKDEVLHVVKIENEWAQLLDETYVYAGYIKKISNSTSPGLMSGHDAFTHTEQVSPAIIVSNE